MLVHALLRDHTRIHVVDLTIDSRFLEVCRGRRMADRLLDGGKMERYDELRGQEKEGDILDSRGEYCSIE